MKATTTNRHRPSRRNTAVRQVATGVSAQAAAQHGSPLIVGEVRKVDKDAKKITIRHEAMPELDMPAMTMVFQVKDPAMLEQVKAGDKVRFQADKSTGAFVLVRLEPVK